MNEQKEVFGYVRVSGKSQVEGDGFDRQEIAIREFCMARGWLVKRIFRESAVSGTVESVDRPAFSEMMSLCGGSLPTTIVVERADRLARDLIVGELLFRECKAASVEVYAADCGEELVNANSDPTRVLIRQVLGALAQWEKSALVKKLRAARDRKRVETGHCEGPKPWNVKNPTEFLATLDWIRVARGRGQSFISIARSLNNLKFKSPRGARWHSASVHRFFVEHINNQPQENQ